MSNQENQNFNLEEDSGKLVKWGQYKTFFGIILVAGFLFVTIAYFMGSDENTKSEKVKEEVVSLSDSTTHVTPQKIWLENAQNQINKMKEENEKLNQKIDQLSSSDVKKTKEGDPNYQALQNQIEVLRKSLENNPANVSSANPGRIFPTQNSKVEGGNNQNSVNVSNQDGIGIDTDMLQLQSQNENGIPKKNPDSFVPAGTFIKAVMLGAADAPAGVTSRADPKPLLFRVVDNGTMPNSKKSHLKGCFVTAAVVGDISSERGDIRLERLSCNFQMGDRVETVEQTIDGTVFGMDGKNGVRGTPVWREGALLTRAAIAGTLSGAASAVSQSYTTTSISPLGNTQSVNNGEIAKYSLAQGGSNAMEKLAEYNIKRADQYHPIIQISAGQPVDLVILKGFYLDGGKHSELDQDQHKTPELFTQTNSSAASGLTLSEKQIQKIQSHESQLNRSLE